MMNATPQPASAENVWTVGRLLDWTRQHFEAKGLDSPRLCAELLLAEAMACRKIELYTRFEQTPPPEQVKRFRELVTAASKHEPISYLIGHKEFFSLDFTVTRDVLIPRPETETLVERALAWCKTLAAERIDVWDLGTGSGCIAAAIARFEPRAHVTASDVSAPALAVARANVERLGLADRVRVVHADGCHLPAENPPSPPLAQGGSYCGSGFDLLLSNPPYIAEAALAELPANVREYEPRVALAAGDGLEFYRRIATDGARFVRPGGRCYVEMGLGQLDEIQAIFEAAGLFSHAGTFRDLAGLDRVAAFERRP